MHDVNECTIRFDACPDDYTFDFRLFTAAQAAILTLIGGGHMRAGMMPVSSSSVRSRDVHTFVLPRFLARSPFGRAFGRSGRDRPLALIYSITLFLILLFSTCPIRDTTHTNKISHGRSRQCSEARVNSARHVPRAVHGIQPLRWWLQVAGRPHQPACHGT